VPWLKATSIDISFFGLNRKKEPYKTCDKCRHTKTTTKSSLAVPNDFNPPKELYLQRHNNDKKDTLQRKICLTLMTTMMGVVSFFLMDIWLDLEIDCNIQKS
jgi:hypothetical protein